MALQDLIISKTKISEELIEGILKNKVRLIEENNEIHILPEIGKPSNNLRVLLYLCGKKAWSLIKNKEIITSIVELSNNLGIKQNTLRPLLKDLKDSRLAESVSGKYYILPMGVTFLQQNLNKQVRLGTDKTANSDEKNIKTREGDFKTQKRASKKGLMNQLEHIIKENFFKTPRSLSEIQIELQKRAFNIPITSLPFYVRSLVQMGKLSRDMELRGNKKIWIYKSHI